MPASSTRTLQGYPVDEAPKVRAVTNDESWQLGPLPTGVDDAPWVLGEPEILVLRRRRRGRARRLLLALAATALAVGAFARMDPLSLGWRRATQPLVDALARRVPTWAVHPVVTLSHAAFTPTTG